MGQGGNAALGGGVALRLRLAHAVPGRGNIDDGRPGRKIRRKELGQVKGRGNAHPQGIVEGVVVAGVQAGHYGQGVVYQYVHPAIFPDDLLREGFQVRLPPHISHEIGIGQQVNHANVLACPGEFVRDGFPDALGSASYHNYPIPKHGSASLRFPGGSAPFRAGSTRVLLFLLLYPCALPSATACRKQPPRV